MRDSRWEKHRSRGRHGAVEMDVLPGAAFLLPDARLLDGPRARRTVGAGPLVEPHVADDRDVAHEANVRLRHFRIPRLMGRAELEVETMEIHPLHEMPRRLGLEAGERRIAQGLVGVPVRLRDALEKRV